MGFHLLEKTHTECEGMNLFVVVGFKPVRIGTRYAQLLIPNRSPIDVFRDSRHTDQDNFATCTSETERVVYCDAGADTVEGNVHTTN